MCNCDDCGGITLFKGQKGDTGATGATGATGLNGANGANGTDGTNGIHGGFSSNWLFSTSITSTYPTSTFLKFDSTTYSAVTNIKVNVSNIDNTNMTNFLNSFKNTINSVNNYGLIRIYESIDSNTFWMGKITSVNALDATTFNIGVEHIQSNGTFLNTDSIIVDFTPFGTISSTKTTVLAIGSWDMLTSATKVLTHGLVGSDIISVTGILRNDAVDAYYPIPYSSLSNSIDLYISSIDNTSITLITKTGSIFQSSNFNESAMNRGYITIITR